jgi:lysophospholipase L1-like esterase
MAKVNAGEEVLLQLTNVTQRAQEKVKELMDQHYKSKSAAEDAAKESEQDRPLVYSQSCREHQLIETQHTPGSTLIAEDRIHPNDAGYDFWGRHIAAAIVREWNEDGNIK